jgi:hypothetical protein
MKKIDRQAEITLAELRFSHIPTFYQEHGGYDINNQNTNLKCGLLGHQGDKPSLFIRLSDGMFFCFTCKKHGDMLQFWKEYYQVPLKVAIEQIAEKFGIDIEMKRGREIKKPADTGFRRWAN